jgi:hypothetical protein
MSHDERTTDELLDEAPFEFVSKLEHDLRGSISTLDSWWRLLMDEEAGEYHAEARQEIPRNIERLIELVDLIRAYKDRQRQTYRGQS